MLSASLKLPVNEFPGKAVRAPGIDARHQRSYGPFGPPGETFNDAKTKQRAVRERIGCVLAFGASRLYLGSWMFGDTPMYGGAFKSKEQGFEASKCLDHVEAGTLLRETPMPFSPDPPDPTVEALGSAHLLPMACRWISVCMCIYVCIIHYFRLHNMKCILCYRSQDWWAGASWNLKHVCDPPTIPVVGLHRHADLL